MEEHERDEDDEFGGHGPWRVDAMSPTGITGGGGAASRRIRRRLAKCEIATPCRTLDSPNMRAVAGYSGGQPPAVGSRRAKPHLRIPTSRTFAGAMGIYPQVGVCAS